MSSLRQVIATGLLLALSSSTVFAADFVYRGMFHNIPIDKNCSNMPASEKMVLILNGPPSSATAGMYYSTESSSGRLRQTTPGTFEMIDPVTEFNKLKPSILRISGSGNKLHITVEEQQVNSQELKEDYCWSKKPPFSVKRTYDNPDIQKKRAEELYTEETMLLEARQLLYKEENYDAALHIGKNLLQSVDRLHGATSRKFLLVLDLVLVPLVEKERYDEALNLIEPFFRQFPDHKDLRELEVLIKKFKDEQDKLFTYDPDKDDGIELKPRG